jgi:hypothetical protein
MIRTKVIYLLLGLVHATGTSAQKEHAPVFKRSDMAILGHTNDIMTWGRYRPDIMAWGHDMAYPWEEGEARVKAEIEMAMEIGMSIVTTNVDIVTATAPAMYYYPELQKAAVRDVANKPVLVYWFAHKFYEGVPTYWNCTNHPEFREHIKGKVTRGLEFGANTVHLDDPRGSNWLERGACFCEHCMEGFRKYLRTHYTNEELNEMGIDSPGSYNYREELFNICKNKEDFIRTYRDQREILPLIDEYTCFHHETVSEFIGELDSLAEVISGMPVYLSINAYGLYPEYMVAMDYVDFFATEINFRNWNGGQAACAFRVADALNMSLAMTANAQDWNYIRSEDASTLVKAWIALGYASGHHFMAPFRQWVFIDGLQSANYTGPTEEFSTVYDFVRKYARYFDAYEAAVQYGILSSQESFRNDDKTVFEISEFFFGNNYPFGIVLAGDKLLDHPFTSEKLHPYEKIIVPQDALLSEEQKELLRMNEERVICYRDHSSVEKLSSLLKVEHAERITVLPRIKPGDPDAPLVIHLINRDFNESGNTMHLKSDFILHIDKKLSGGRGINSARLLHFEGGESVPKIEPDSSGINVRIPELDLWDILLLN